MTVLLFFIITIFTYYFYFSINLYIYTNRSYMESPIGS